ncbi:PAS domain S-box-containing protein [Duganella sacchari]|uniref:histidine kinase n=1 Tax=Duganella sacchari TaxID=551987 RepID=A0A1M7R6U0_9BURK|nr:response regulator [Duganella sacchari]SHN41963.1 PAS domain S-box-containing protein [Duganella sacchari]
MNEINNSTVLILNVDDNDGARYVKSRILQNAGFQVAEAANGTDALLMASKLVPALVLLDVKLPDINGIEVCRQIKADVTTCSVLVLQTSAALTGRDDKIRGLEGGADNYLAAPIEADELIANVNALLRLQRTQMALRNSEERFRQLTDNIEDVFWMFDLEGGALLYVSKAYDQMWGRSTAQLQQSPDDWLAAIHAEDRAAVGAHWQAVRRGEHYDQEYRLLLAGGAERWVRDRAFPVRDAADIPYRIARITSDITHRKQMERLLHAADENKNDFLATLAHELRNPLSPIRNAVALMNATGVEQEEVHHKARDVIMRQVGHLSRLVDDLLDVARISEGKLMLRMQDVELHTVLEPALETVRPLIEARGHVLHLEVPTQPIWLHGDPVRLAQAVGNLLHNAAKFTNRGGEIRLRVSMPVPEKVRIAISDNGIGITDYNLPRIFNMFAQGASAHDRAHDGLGIGLSLVSTLAGMHGGSVMADSPGIDQGSTFVIELPVLAQAPAPAAPSPSPETPAARRVLLVDDNVDSAEVMGELLKFMGHTIYLAHDADGALAMAREHRPDVIILDIGLPNVDGHAVARMLRADPLFVHTRLVAHTGFGSDRDRENTAASGFDYHLVKPASFDELAQVLKVG